MRKFVEDTLQKFGYYSVDAANLILGTIAQESYYGKKRNQDGNGPALGIAQIEPATFNDIVKNYLRYHPDITDRIKTVCHVNELNAIELLNNDRLAVCMCRVHFLRVAEALPISIEGYAKYWKQYYNTVKGKGTEAEFIRNYYLYVMNDRG